MPSSNQRRAARLLAEAARRLRQRLRDGTWLGHVAEHVALELQTMAGTRVTRGKTRSVKGKPGVYNVMFAYPTTRSACSPAGSRSSWSIRCSRPSCRDEGLDRIYEIGGEFDFERRLDALKRLVRPLPTGRPPSRWSTRRGGAASRSCGSTRQPDPARPRPLSAAHPRQHHRPDLAVAVDAAGDKDFTKKLLDDSGIPVPRGVVVRDVEEAVREARRLRYPLVTKPLDGNHGRGVTIGIKDEEQLRFGFEEAQRRPRGRDVIVEQFFEGNDHRILVVDGKLVAVAERVPAHVVGDGVHTIAQLVEEVNKDPRRGEGHEKVMTRIKIDAHVTEYLARSGLTPDSVPEPGQIVYLRATANLSTGGTAVDRTNEIHPTMPRSPAARR
jgi:cyanophycin synthetase